jgi:hypothetical protein
LATARSSFEMRTAGDQGNRADIPFTSRAYFHISRSNCFPSLAKARTANSQKALAIRETPLLTLKRSRSCSNHPVCFVFIVAARIANLPQMTENWPLGGRLPCRFDRTGFLLYPEITNDQAGVDIRMNSDRPPEKSHSQSAQHFRLSVRIFAGILCFIITVTCLEIGLRLWSFAMNTDIRRLGNDTYQRLYSPEEMRWSESLNQENPCVHQNFAGMHWDPRFGYASKILDKACAKDLFRSDKTKVLLFGGSTMNSALAPNYLTTIEHYAFGDNPNVVSINLAESGARLWNMFARFLYEGVELRPNVAVFLFGNLEFASIQYGGPPTDDFYWTAGVNRRVHHPLMYFLDKIIEESKLAEALLIKTGIYPSARIPVKKIDLSLVDDAVAYYFRTQENTAAICEHYSIKCFFILQPTPLAQSHLNARDRLIVQEDLKYFPSDQEVISRGYTLLKQGRDGNHLLDPSELFEGVPDTYFDVQHYTKVGNALLGKYIHDAVAQNAADVRLSGH